MFFFHIYYASDTSISLIQELFSRFIAYQRSIVY